MNRIDHCLFLLSKGSSGRWPVVYWMSRDQRAANNWALIAATHEANVSNRPLLVIFTLVPDGANSRQVQFMLSGLKETEANLRNQQIPMVLPSGSKTHMR